MISLYRSQTISYNLEQEYTFKLILYKNIIISCYIQTLYSLHKNLR